MASAAQARIAVAREAVEALRSELQDEVHKRVEAVRRFGVMDVNTPDMGSKNNLLENSVQSDLPPLPNGDALLSKEENVTSQGGCSPLTVISTSEEAAGDDPFQAGCTFVYFCPGLRIDKIVAPAYLSNISDDSAARDESPLDASPTLLITDEPPPYKQEQSPAVSVLDLNPAPHLYPTKEPSPTPSPPLDNVDIQVTLTPQAMDPAHLSSPTSDSASSGPSDLQTQIVHSESTTALLHSLSGAKHRYVTLQRALRDCSLTLKELKRTLGSPSPSSPHRMVHRSQHLLTALSRIDDFTEDVRVELEIRIADEELTVHGFETLLSVPGALSDADERTEMEANARRFVDGTDDGVQKALERFERKLDDVQHDVAILKRTVHEVSLAEADSEDRTRDRNNKSSAWTSWTAGLLTPTSNSSRPTTPAPTFGSVMTSPRLRHAGSSKQLRGGPGENGDPLSGLGFRIPMPSASPIVPTYPAGLGLGNAPGVRPRTISTIYSLGLGARSSSSAAINIGLGSVSSPSSAHPGSIPSTPVTSGLGPSPLSARMGSAGPKRRGSILTNESGPDGALAQDDEPSDVE